MRVTQDINAAKPVNINISFNIAAADAARQFSGDKANPSDQSHQSTGRKGGTLTMNLNERQTAHIHSKNNSQGKKSSIESARSHPHQSKGNHNVNPTTTDRTHSNLQPQHSRIDPQKYLSSQMAKIAESGPHKKSQDSHNNTSRSHYNPKKSPDQTNERIQYQDAHRAEDFIRTDNSYAKHKHLNEAALSFGTKQHFDGGFGQITFATPYAPTKPSKSSGKKKRHSLFDLSLLQKPRGHKTVGSHHKAHSVSAYPKTERKNKKPQLMVSFNQSGSVPWRKKKDKGPPRKSLGSLRQIRVDPTIRSISVLQSQPSQDDQHPQRRKTIVIKTDHSIDLDVSEWTDPYLIRRPEQHVADLDALKKTQLIIQAYIDFGRQDSQEIDLGEFDRKWTEREKYRESDRDGQNIKQGRILQDSLNHRDQDGLHTPIEPFISHSSPLSQAQRQQYFLGPSPVNTTKINLLPAELTPRQVEAEQTGPSQQLVSTVAQLKKQEFQKWAYLLDFIKSKLPEAGDRQQSEALLNEVSSYLQQTKNALQKDIIGFQTGDLHEMESQFTVRLSTQLNKVKQQHQKAQNNDRQNYHHEHQSQEDEEEEEEEPVYQTYQSQQESLPYHLKQLNLEAINETMNAHFEALNLRRDRQLFQIESKLKHKTISEQQYIQERGRIIKWLDGQIEQLQQARRSIMKGYLDAQKVLEKSANSRYFERADPESPLHGKARKMLKSLSESYLLKTALNVKRMVQQSSVLSNRGQFSPERINNSPYQTHRKQTFKQKSETLLNPPRLERQQPRLERPPPLQTDSRSQGSDDPYYYQASEDGGEDSDSNSESPEPSEEFDHPSPVLVTTPQSSPDMDAIRKRLEVMREEICQAAASDLDEPALSGNDSDSPGRETDEMGIILQPLNPLAKLKYMAQQDNEDIFEFIFLDLCIELYQEEAYTTRYYPAIIKCLSKSKQTRKKGFKTSLDWLREYVAKMEKYILTSNFEMLKRMQVPMGPSVREMLRFMQEEYLDTTLFPALPNMQQSIEQQPPVLVLENSIFDDFQRSIDCSQQFTLFYQEEEKEAQRLIALKGLLRLHNRAVFDCLNEHLDQCRPFGIWGKPFPWKNSASFMRDFSDNFVQNHLKASMTKVIECCSAYCGLLVDKEESLIGQARYNESYIEEVKEDRLSRMLASDLIESEERWLFLDDEEAQIIIHIGRSVQKQLIQEVVFDLIRIGQEAEINTDFILKEL